MNSNKARRHGFSANCTFTGVGTFPYLYRNEGAGTFRNVSSEAGVQVRNPDAGVPIAKSLGLVLVDLDHDGGMDVVAANDTVQNFVFHNRRDGTFQEVTKQRQNKDTRPLFRPILARAIPPSKAIFDAIPIAITAHHRIEFLLT